jgi:RNA polymerase sigma-70 factor (ECF subfamily)
MAHHRDTEDPTVLERAIGGDREAFDQLIRTHLPTLRAVVRRMVGHPEDTDDLVQESLLRAWNARDSFRGDARFGTWLCAIGTRAAIDHLRRRKRWRPAAQVAYAHACVEREELGMEVGATLAAPDFAYEVREHIAFCFSCVGRSLAPEEQAALLLTEVLGLTGREAATSLEMSEPTFRHTLAAARRTMTTTYEGLCALVNKKGVCYQCKGLREGVDEARRGEEAPALPTFEDRLAVVRARNVDSGVSQRLHDVFWRRIEEIEEQADGAEVPMMDCPP